MSAVGTATGHTKPTGAPGSPGAAVTNPVAKTKVAPVDAFDVHSVQALVKTPSVKSTTTIPGIAESFPIASLSKIEGKSLSGETFFLDGGSLSAMKLQVRRVVDEGQKGMDLVLRVDGKELARLEAALKKKGAHAGPVRFRGAELGDDGITRYTTSKGTVTEDSSYAPSDMSSNDDAWSFAFAGKNGGEIELIHGKAAYSARGLIRVSLRGDDTKCTQQLKELSNALGLSHLFAPSTPKSQQRFKLMRLLWQVDHSSAQKLSGGDVNKISIPAIEKLLGAKGITEARMKEARFSDVAPSHFTAVDPGQAKQLMEKGARYLYSTVESVSHVSSILKGGQKSSLRRYKDGLIIDGMSTNEDFSSGGGAGVFTRVVTQNAILEGEGWTGRTYKIILKPEILARTDWFGWDNDKFGQAWGLKSNVNFGPALLESVDAHGSYQDYNELIFRDAIGPQYIGRVVATNASDRSSLLDALEKQGFVPPDGTTLEDFVVLAPKFMQYGPDPYEFDDAAKFAAEAIAKAKKGDSTPLKWFLMAGPGGEARADVEQSLLLGKSDTLRDLLFESIERGGAFAMTAKQIDEVFTKLGGSNKESDKELLDRLARKTTAALLKSDSSHAAAYLKKHNKALSSTGYYSPGPLSLNDDAWVEVLTTLAAKQTAGKRSKAFGLALDLATVRLLNNKNRGFYKFLEKHPLVQPEDPAKFLTTQIKALKTKSASTDLRLFLAAAKTPDDIADAQLMLLASNTNRAKDLLEATLKKHGQFGGDPSPVVAAVTKLAANSATRTFLLAGGAVALAKTGEPKLIAMLEAKWKAGSSLHQESWHEVMTHLEENGHGVTSKAMSWAMARSAKSMMTSYSGEEGKAFDARLRKMKLLTTAEAPKKIDAAVKSLAKKGHSDARLVLGWALAAGTKGVKEHAAEALLESGSQDARDMLEWAKRQQPDGQIPISPKKLVALATKLSTDKTSSGKSAFRWLVRNSAKTLIVNANKAMLDVLKEQDSYDLGLYGDGWIETASLVADQGGSKATLKWLVDTYGKNALSSEGEKAVGLFRKLDLAPKDLGLDTDGVTEQIHSIMEDLLYELNDHYHDDEDEALPTGMPESVKWLLENGSEPVDDAILTAVLKKLPEWQEDMSESWTPFLERLSYLPAKYNKKIKAVQKKLDDL